VIVMINFYENWLAARRIREMVVEKVKEEKELAMRLS